MDTILISLRCHYDKEQDIHWYILNWKNWLEYRDYTVTASSFGIHKNSGNFHFHFHCIALGKMITNSIATLQRDFNMGKVKTTLDPTRHSNLTNFVGQKYKNKINMSVKLTRVTDINDDVTNYLQYPLKEGLSLQKYNHGLEEYGGYEELLSAAKGIYKAALYKQQKEKEREENKLTEWQQLVNHLDKHSGADTFIKIFREVLLYHRVQDKKPPTIRAMRDNAERYCFIKEILTLEDICRTSTY